MIHHYVNLVCWYPVSVTVDKARDLVWLDSVSSKLLVRVFRRGATYYPGTVALAGFQQRDSFPEGWFFITANPLRSVPFVSQIALPFLADEKIVQLPDNVLCAVGALPSGTRVAIGVSSPKQNRIAQQLHGMRPDLEYHCLGAALSNLDEVNDEEEKSRALSGSGFEWISFLTRSPQRTIRKIKLTIVEILMILALPSYRDQFRRFAAICESKST